MERYQGKMEKRNIVFERFLSGRLYFVSSYYTDRTGALRVHTPLIAELTSGENKKASGTIESVAQTPVAL